MLRELVRLLRFEQQDAPGLLLHEQGEVRKQVAAQQGGDRAERENREHDWQGRQGEGHGRASEGDFGLDGTCLDLPTDTA